MELNLKQLGHNIKSYRLEAGITQVDLADSIGTTSKQIYRWEEGWDLKISSLYKIAMALGLGDATRLLDGVDWIDE